MLKHREMTSAVEIDPTSLEWTERELRRQVRELMVETEARENAADQARKEQEALRAAQEAARPEPRVARRSKSARARGVSSRKSRVGSGARRRSSRRSSGSVRARVTQQRQGSGSATLWIVFGAAAVGLLGLVALAL